MRAFVERAGRRTAVSHMVKATRGDVARLLLEAPEPPDRRRGGRRIAGAAGHDVELARGRAGWSLDVIERA